MFKQKKSPRPNEFADKAAGKIARVIVRVQKVFGNTMNKMTRHFSALTWKILIVVTAIAWGVISMKSIAKGLEKKIPVPTAMRRANTTTVHTDSLQLLEHIYEQRKKN